MAKLEVPVSAESVIHDALVEFAENVYNAFGVRIDSAEIKWSDHSNEWILKRILRFLALN